MAALSFEFRFQWFCDDAGLMRMREHLETRVHIGEGGPCPRRFEACLGSANKRAVTTQLNHRARCLNGALRALRGSKHDWKIFSFYFFLSFFFDRFFSLFILSFFSQVTSQEGNKEVNFPFILSSRIPFFFCARIDGGLLLLRSWRNETDFFSLLERCNLNQTLESLANKYRFWYAHKRIHFQKYLI